MILHAAAHHDRCGPASRMNAFREQVHSLINDGGLAFSAMSTKLLTMGREV